MFISALKERRKGSKLDHMAVPSSYHKNKLNIAAILVTSILLLPSKPDGLGIPSCKINNSVNGGEKQLQIGSRPPTCVHKCSSCRPCMATLIIHPPHRKRYKASSGHAKGGDDDDDIYYHLSWKCKCGNKLYRP